MSNVTVCARFRPLSSKERREHGDSVCIRSIDSETLAFKDDKEELAFSFDRVFYQDSEQADVYGFLAQPIVQDSVNAINGTIITYGQTGAGKTYTMEGSSILEYNEQKNGLLTRVVDGLFELIARSDAMTKYTIKLAMVEIYMEKVRDLLDISKDNIQIKESKVRGIVLSGVTEVPVSDPAEALQCLSSGIANRAVGETQMNMASSRSHCVYLFTVQHELTKDERVRTGKLILVDLAGSEKVEKTGAEGRILEEAKTINKSLSALGNVINALTSGVPSKANHIPYRDSKLSRILQDALGGNSRTALLCCCSPSPSNASESLSTLRFGARAKHIKTTVRVNCYEDKNSRKLFSSIKEENSHTENHSSKRITSSASSTKDNYSTDDESCKDIAHSAIKDSSPTRYASHERISKKLRERLNAEDVNFLEELFEVEGIFSNPDSPQDLESAYKTATSKKISALQKGMEGLAYTVEKLYRENKVLRAKLAVTRVGANASFSQKMSHFVVSLLQSFSLDNVLKCKQKVCSFLALNKTWSRQ